MAQSSDSNSPLFPPYSERTLAQFPARPTIPLLSNAPYDLYKQACVRLVIDWLDGKVGMGAPAEEWERRLIAVVNDQMHWKVEANDGARQSALSRDRFPKAERLYGELVKRKALTHLRTAMSHRNWLRMSFKFSKMIGVSFSGDMENLIKKHDLSKFTPEEVLGYAVMFGDGQVNWKQLETEEEKTEWNLALQHHYIFNPHHPEYFYPKQADGTREKFSILEADQNGKLYLEESVLDMLASRGERNLKDDPTISLGKWMDIPEVYLARYSDKDKQYVSHLLKTWSEMGKTFVSDSQNSEESNLLFWRPVVL